MPGNDTNTQELSAYCKEQCGLSVKELSENSGVPRRTLYERWGNLDYRRSVSLMILGIKYEIEKG